MRRIRLISTPVTNETNASHYFFRLGCRTVFFTLLHY